MIADIGTRRCTSLDAIKQGSIWIEGFQWMKEPERNFPMMTAEEVTLRNQDFQNMRAEIKEDIYKLAYIVQDHIDSNNKPSAKTPSRDISCPSI